MKRLLCILLMGAFFVGCGGTKTDETANKETAKACSDIYEECIAGGSFNDMTELDSEYIYNYYGIDAESVNDFAAGEASDVMKADTLILLREDDSDSRAELVKALESFRDQKAEELRTYNPEEYDKAAGGLVGESGDIVYTVICENAEDIVDIIEGLD